MPSIQQGPEAGSTAQHEAGQCANSNEAPSANRVEATGLPPAPPPPQRWVPHRKAEIVAAVRGGFLSLEQALERYALSMEEYLTWQHGVDLFGLAGLRVNKTQRRRDVRSPTTGR